MNITAIDILWLMLATATTSGVLIILSALVTGYLVFRTKKEQHEMLFPKTRRKSNGPIVRDEFSDGDKHDDDGLPDVIKKMNARFAEDQARTALKARENG